MTSHFFNPKILLAFPLLAGVQQTQAKSQKPNVLVIITDDQGIGDFGFINKLVKTPNIDQLEKEAAVYTNFVACPASSPSRVSLYTGRNYLRTGVWGVPPRANMQPDETLMPRFFKSAGYSTYLLGKRDCTQPVGCEPWEAGWDNGFTVTGYQQKDPKMGTKTGMENKSGYTSEIMCDEAIKFINGQNKNPWFISLNFITPHMPWVCSPEFAQPYKDAGYSDLLASCWGAITQMDAALGRVLATLKQKGLDENTIIFLYSDNGATSPEVQKLVGKKEQEVPGEDWKLRNALHLRAYKSSTYQNGMRVPMLIKYLGKVAPGERKQFARVEDVLPTILELSGNDFSKVNHLPFDGVSIVENLKDANRTVNVPAAFRINIAHEGAPRTTAGIVNDPAKLRITDHHLAVLNGKYVYHNLPGSNYELYDLSKDPEEKINLINTEPDVAKELAATCKTEWEDIIHSGRAFNMPALQIGRLLWTQKPETENIFPASFVKEFTGSIYCSAQQMEGFYRVGDKVKYRLDVVTPGKYYVFFRGANFDKCGAVQIKIGNTILKADVNNENELAFGSYEFTAKDQIMELESIGSGEQKGSFQSLIITKSSDISKIPVKNGAKRLKNEME